MRIDLDQHPRPDTANLDAVAPWDLTVCVGGRELATRRPTLGLIARIRAMNGKTLQSVAADMLGDAAAVPPESMLAVVNAYMAYFGRQAESFYRAVSLSVEAEIAPEKANGKSDATQTPTRTAPAAE